MWPLVIASLLSYGAWSCLGRRKSERDEQPTVREQHEFLDAAKSSNFSKVQRMVLRCPELVNCQPCGRWSALHHAAQKGNARAIRFLLEHGASTSLRTRDGLSPVELAAADVFDDLLQATLAETNSAVEASKEKPSDAVASEETLKNLPTMKFTASVGSNALDDEPRECHICLEDFKDGEELRKLGCGHSFHVGCVDTWLRSKSSCCPVCRMDCTTNSGFITDAVSTASDIKLTT